MPRDHFVPQFYLRSFSINKDGKKLYEYTRGKSTEECGIRVDACNQEDYELLSDGDSSFREKLKKIDQQAVLCFQKLQDATDVSVIKENKVVLSKFIGHQIARTELMRIKMKNRDMARNDFRNQLMENKKEYVDRLVKNGSSKEDAIKTAKTAFHAPLSFINPEPFSEKYNDPNDAWLIESMELGSLLGKYITSKKDWVIFETNSEAPFFTSDNPVAPIPINGRMDLGLDGSFCGDFLMPISPTRCLFITNGLGDSPEVIAPVRKFMMPFFYKSISAFAREHLYSNIDSKEFQDIFGQTKQIDIEKILCKWISDKEWKEYS